MIRQQDSMATLMKKHTESSFSVVLGNEALVGSGSSIAGYALNYHGNGLSITTDDFKFSTLAILPTSNQWAQGYP